MNRIKLLLLSTLLAGSLAATEYNFYNETIVLETASGSAWDDGEISLRFGKFTNGFTATSANADDWDSHWISFNISGSANGYYSPQGPEWNAGFAAADNAVFASGEQLYVWAFNSIDGATREWALFTDASWLVQTNSQIDPTLHAYEFGTGTQALLGGYDFDGDFASTAAVGSTIPEPSAWAALLGGGALVCALARRRRHNC